MTAPVVTLPAGGEVTASDGPFVYKVCDVERSALAAHLTGMSRDGWVKDFILPVMPVNYRSPYFTVGWKKLSIP